MIITFDIGGTTTKAGISTNGLDFHTVLTESTCKPSVVGYHESALRIHAIATKLCAKLGVGFSEIHGLCIGIAGIATPAERTQLIDELYRVANARLDRLPKTHIVSDIECAYAGAFGNVDTPGIVILSGTGSVAYGKTESTEIYRSGGYGYPISDEGSGMWIAYQASKAVIAHMEGCGAATKLTEIFQQQFTITNTREFALQVNNNNQMLSQIPPLLFECCLVDTVANDIIEQASTHLVQLATSLTKKFTTRRNIPCSIAGSVATHPKMSARIGERCTIKPTSLKFQQPEGNGLHGALIIAKEIFG
ncbi:MAG: hypothetical protein K1X91_12190 [Bacteriodetes bacterium]|nr:hypothetical protein [Bacteroidota bacterium]